MILSTLAKELTAATGVMQSSSIEVSDCTKCKETKAKTYALMSLRMSSKWLSD